MERERIEATAGTDYAKKQEIDLLSKIYDNKVAKQEEQLDRFAAQVTGIMGGYPGQTQQTITPNPTPLQTALGVGTTLAGIYGGVTGKLNPFSFGR